MHHTTSGARLSFQAIASAMTRAAPSGSETSALMYWNRWEEEAADAWKVSFVCCCRGEAYFDLS